MRLLWSQCIDSLKGNLWNIVGYYSSPASYVNEGSIHALSQNLYSHMTVVGNKSQWQWGDVTEELSPLANSQSNSNI